MRRTSRREGYDRLEITCKDLLAIIKLVQETDLGYVEIETGDLRFVLGSGPDHAPPAPPDAPAPPQPPVSTAAPASAAAPAGPALAGAEAEDDRLVAVPAPMLGVFYARPEPGAEPFVRAGDHVDADATLGLIEVMKVFSAVRSPARGVVVSIAVADAQMVEYGQTLCTIRRD